MILYFLLLFLLLKFNFVDSKRFSGHEDAKIRKCLLGGLRRFHSNSPSPVCTTTATNNCTFLAALPSEVKQDTLESLLDLKSLKQIAQVSKQTAAMTDQIIARKLAKFNRHFVFKDMLVNSLLLLVLERHFKNSQNLESVSIHDDLQLLILKFTHHGHLNYSQIPRNIYFYFIAFINETVYGIGGSRIPTSPDQFEESFPRLLSKFQLPNTLQYFTHIYQCRCQIDTAWFNGFLLFSQKPSKEQVKAFFNIHDINTWTPQNGFSVPLMAAITEALIEEYTDDSISAIVHHWLFNQSPSIQERHFANLTEQELITSINDNEISWLSKVTACSNLLQRFEKSPPICHFITRNTKNQVSLDILLEPQNSIHILNYFESITFNYNLNIYDYELFLILFDSPYVSEMERSNRLTFFVQFNEFSLFEILIKESKRPFFYFLSPPDGTSIHRALFPQSWNMFLEFLYSISDPIICLISLLSGVIPDSHIIHEIISVKIQKNLMDLNKIYKIEIEVKSSINEFNGRTMHFKQILKELNNPKLSNVFGLNSTDLNQDYSTIDESLPIVIVDEYYTFTPHSH